MKPAWNTVAGDGFEPETASNALRPGLAHPDITFRPWQVRARLKPTSWVTSQTAPRAARSSHWRRSGSARASNMPRRRASRFRAASSTNDTPAAASTPWPELHPGRLGLTTAAAAGAEPFIR